MKHFSKPVFCAIFLFMLASSLKAQDPRFSQYYASPWNLNPALTGVFNGRWRATVNYRDQWNSVLSPVPFRTYAAAYEYRVEVANEDYASFGIGAMHDEAGTARFVQNKVHLGGAYLKKLSGGPRRASHYLSAGAQLGMGQNSIDWSQLWFSRQFDPGTQTPDYSAANGEANANANSAAYLDFNAGLLWYMVFDNDGYFYAGGGMHHLNAPVISLVENNSETLYSRWTGHAGGLFPVSHNLALMPSVLVMKQGPSLEATPGVNVRYSNNDYNEVAVRAGMFTRLANKLDKSIHVDALTVVGMLEMNRWTLGLSYDITVSKLAVANNNSGAFEVSLMYFQPAEKRARVVCPRF
jgi:type IX secretion system PorP/SprF family membrane protein